MPPSPPPVVPSFVVLLVTLSMTTHGAQSTFPSVSVDDRQDYPRNELDELGLEGGGKGDVDFAYGYGADGFSVFLTAFLADSDGLSFFALLLFVFLSLLLRRIVFFWIELAALIEIPRDVTVKRWYYDFFHDTELAAEVERDFS